MELASLYYNPLNSLIRNGHIQSDIFSVYLDLRTNQGELVLGGWNQTRQPSTDNFTWITINYNVYDIPIDYISMGNVEFPIDMPAQIDFSIGRSLRLPWSIIRMIIFALNNSAGWTDE